MNFVNNIKCNRYQLIEAVAHKSATTPSTPVSGQLWYDTTNNKLKVYNGTAWIEAESYIKSVSASLPLQASVDANGLLTLTIQSTNANTANYVVQRDASGNFSAGTITATLNGSALSLTNSRNFSITGKVTASSVSFNGTGDVALNVTAVTLNKTDLSAVTQYRLDEFTAPTSSLNLNGQRITNLGAPSQPTDAARLQDIQNTQAGIDAKESVRVASTANVTVASPGSAIDGITMVIDNRVLLKNQATQSENGIWLWKGAAVSMVRASDGDTGDLTCGAYVYVEEGTTNAGTQWLLNTANPITVGTTSLTWVQWGGAGTVVMVNLGTGACVYSTRSGQNYNFRSLTSGNTAISVSQNTNDISFTFNAGNVDKNTLGGSALSIANGGTGATTAAGARQNISATGKYAASIGNASASQFTVTHNLNTTDVQVSVFETAGNKELVFPDIAIIDANSVQLTFGTAPTSNQYRVIVIG